MILRKRGLSINTGTSVTEIREDGNEKVVLATAKDGSIKEFRADLVLSAVGRVPNFGGIDLDGLGVAYDRKGIKADGCMATNVPGIWAKMCIRDRGSSWLPMFWAEGAVLSKWVLRTAR